MIAEFRWLPNSLTKNISLPKIIMEELNNQCYAGKYVHAGNIYLVPSCFDENFTMEATIAHEFCHFLQYINVNRMENIYSANNYYNTEYNTFIRRYFTLNIREYEALLFENKICPNEENKWRLKKIVQMN